MTAERPFFGGRVWLAFKIFVSAGLLAVLISRADLQEVVRSAASTSPVAVLIALLVALVSWAVNTLKWQRLLEATGYRLKYSSLFNLNLVGLFYSLLLPGQISGEVVKGIKLARSGVTIGVVAATIAVDRIGGVVAICLLVIVGLSLGPALANLLAPILIIAVSLLAVACVPFLLLKAGTMGARSESLIKKLGYPGRVLASLMSTLKTFSTLKDNKIITVTLSLSILSQLLVALSNFIVAWGMGLEIPFVTMLWIVSAVSLVHMVPISFAGLGVREGAYVFLLHEHGVPVPVALTLSLTVFGIILVQGLLGGALDMLGHSGSIKTSVGRV